MLPATKKSSALRENKNPASILFYGIETGMRYQLAGLADTACSVLIVLRRAFGAPLYLERVMGIEPTLEAWKATVLPLNYTRNSLGFAPATPTSAAMHASANR